MLSQSDSRSRVGKRPALVTSKPKTPDQLDVLGLMQNLQSSLELEVMLPFLLEHISLSVPNCRLNYHLPSLDIALDLGGPKLKNQCFYQLKIDQESLGELIVSSAKKFSEEDLASIENALTHLLYPLRNAIMYQQAVRNARLDSLTGVGNRFAFSRSFEREQLLARRHQSDLSLLIIDVDHFKKINDHYGHLVGDKVLKEIAHALQSIMRQTDMIFRYGGEEFTAILTKTNRRGAQVIAERLRQQVANLAIAHENEMIHVTVSIGIGSLLEVESDRELFEQADDNLYMAKRQGRNRVV